MQADQAIGLEARELDRLALRPLAFMWHYVRRHTPSHAIVLLSVIAAVAFATFSQYAVRNLVDLLSARDTSGAWTAERQFGTRAGRITATANAIYQVENTFAWSVLPPALAGHVLHHRDLLARQAQHVTEPAI